MTDYELLEDVESFESDEGFDEELEALLESDESRRRPRRTPPVGTGRGYYRPRPTNYVTQPQMAQALLRISGDIRANGAAIKTVGARAEATERRLTGVVKKEASDRRKALAKIKSGMQMAALLPMLTSKTITTRQDDELGGVEIKAGTKLSVAPDGMAALLPMMLMGDGFGGGSGGDDGGGNMLFLALAMSGGL